MRNPIAMWKYDGQQRPDFAETPEPGQESVWDYPRPPVTDHSGKRVEVFSPEHCLATTRAAIRVLETASPPTFYLPPDDVQLTALVQVDGSSSCEWKGNAVYYALHTAPSTPIAWSYPNPSRRFAAIRDYLSFYPGRVACYVDGERVKPQPGGFYGGWLTDDIAGPVKGEPGTGHW